MNAMKNKIPWLFTVLLVVLLFISSSQDADRSNVLSLSFAEWVVRVLMRIPAVADGTDPAALLLGVNYLIRKIAHFSIFALLAVSLFFSFWKLRDIRRYPLTLLLVFLCACGDELHQRFTGRDDNILDVGIDMTGVIVALLLIMLIRRAKERRSSAK
jgi:VanZ family protein